MSKTVLGKGKGPIFPIDGRTDGFIQTRHELLDSEVARGSLDSGPLVSLAELRFECPENVSVERLQQPRCQSWHKDEPNTEGIASVQDNLVEVKTDRIQKQNGLEALKVGS